MVVAAKASSFEEEKNRNMNFCNESFTRSAMYKLVKEIVPQVRLSGEAKDLIVNACNEFIHLLASEANTVCEKQSKKLILPDHVLLALDNLGFSEYKEDCVEVMKQMRDQVSQRRKLRNKLDKPGIPEEELLRQQNLLFAEARKQQQLMENADEWSKVQQEAQMALQRQASTSNGGGDNKNHQLLQQAQLQQQQQQQQNYLNGGENQSRSNCNNNNVNITNNNGESSRNNQSNSISNKNNNANNNEEDDDDNYD